MSNTFQKIIGFFVKTHEILKKFRKSTKFSQSDLANIIKTERSNYGRKENGKVPFTADELFLVLNFLKNHITDEEYLNAVTELLSSQSNSEENKENSISLPSPLDPAIEILKEFLQEEKKEIVMEKAGPLIQLIREMIAQEENTNNETNELLNKLEKLSIKEYYRIFGDIKETVTNLQKQKDLNASEGL